MTSLPFKNHSHSPFHDLCDFFKRSFSLYRQCEDLLENPTTDRQTMIDGISAQIDALESDAMKDPANDSDYASQFLKRVIVADEMYALSELEASTLFPEETRERFAERYQSILEKVQSDPNYPLEFYKQLPILLAKAIQSGGDDFSAFIESKFSPYNSEKTQLYPTLMACYHKLIDDVALPAPVADALLFLAQYYSGDEAIFEIYEEYSDLDTRIFPCLSPEKKLEILMGVNPADRLFTRDIEENDDLRENLQTLGLQIPYDLEEYIPISKIKTAIETYEAEKTRILGTDVRELIGINPPRGS